MAVHTTSPGEINALAALTRSAPENVVSSIRQASTRTGVDFAYLVQQARAESAFDPQARAATSSATGLYQFIESTWLGMVRDYGGKYGLGEYAGMIDSNGRVSEPARKEEILALRRDPEAASMLAAEFALQNKRFLERNWGGEIGATELYFAHFMGAGGAASFLQARDENPLAAGADLFPKEARANRNVFYDSETGKPRTLAGIYEFFDKKFSVRAQNPSGPPPARTAETGMAAVSGAAEAGRYAPDSGDTAASTSPPSKPAPAMRASHPYAFAGAQAARDDAAVAEYMAMMTPRRTDTLSGRFAELRFLSGRLLLAPHDIALLGSLR